MVTPNKTWNPIFFIDENQGGGEETPQMIKVGENEYSPEDLQGLVEKANRYDPLEKDYTKKSQRLSQLEKDVPTLESAKKLYGLMDENQDLGNAVRTLVAKAIAGEPISLAEKKAAEEEVEEMTPFQKKLLSRIEDQDKRIKEFQSTRDQDISSREQEERVATIKKEFPRFAENAHDEIILLSYIEQDPKQDYHALAERIDQKCKEHDQAIIDKYIADKKGNANTNPLKPGSSGKLAKEILTFDEADDALDKAVNQIFGK